VSAAHQVADLAFHLWSGGSVFGSPSRVFLVGAGPDKFRFVQADLDDAPSLSGRALGGQRAPAAGRAEGRDPTRS